MLVLIGCNHRSAPIALRERLAFRAEDIPAVLGRLLELPGVDEAVILSTCNRLELLARTDGATQSGVETLKCFLADERKVGRDELDRHLYHLIAGDAVQHLFQVATGLDSMILGEPQILGQVKEAYLTAKNCAATGTVLEHLMQQCLATAKRVRTMTGISRNAVSVAFAAVNLAKQIFGDLHDRKALLIGAGKMSRLVARHLAAGRVEQIYVSSRTYNHAVVLAEEVEGQALHWADALGSLSKIDIVVSCTGDPGLVLRVPDVAAALRARRGEPLFIIDIAVPRDVDPGINRLDNVYLYDIDGLQAVVDSNLKERLHAAEHARQEIAREAQVFARWRQSLEITPTIVRLRQSMQAIGRRELERFRGRIGPLAPEQQRALENLTHALIQKVLHRPIVHLKKSVERGDVDASTSAYRKIFGLDEAQNSHDPETDRGARSAEGESAPAGPQRLLKGGKDN